MVEFKLRFPLKDLERYASKYSYARSEDEVIANGEIIKARGFLLKEELQLIANWKTPRSRPHVAKNDEQLVKEVTQFAFSTNSEKLRIEVLNLLDGISWPTASTILHFYHKDSYPILDFRALYSLSSENVLQKDYCFEFWMRYTDFVRNLSAKTGLSMRTIDRGLWQYSKGKNKNPNSPGSFLSYLLAVSSISSQLFWPQVEAPPKCI